MSASNTDIIKDDENELSIPCTWRSSFIDIVEAFSIGDFQLSVGIEGVMPVSEKSASYIRHNVEAYGEKLVSLPSETWKSSVYIWMGSHWDVLIDLWTASEGRSDLVLSAKVFEIEDIFSIEVGLVYVP